MNLFLVDKSDNIEKIPVSSPNFIDLPTENVPQTGTVIGRISDFIFEEKDTGLSLKMVKPKKYIVATQGGFNYHLEDWYSGFIGAGMLALVNDGISSIPKYSKPFFNYYGFRESMSGIVIYSIDRQLAYHGTTQFDTFKLGKTSTLSFTGSVNLEKGQYVFGTAYFEENNPIVATDWCVYTFLINSLLVKYNSILRFNDKIVDIDVEDGIIVARLNDNISTYNLNMSLELLDV